MSTNQGGALPQFINPQHTDKMYHEHRLEQCYATPQLGNGLPSSCLTSPSSTNTRGLTIDISDASILTPDSSPASAMGSSGFITPNSMSTASSRRPSLILPEHQQCLLTSAAQNQASPTPGPRRASARTRNEPIHSPLSAFFSSYLGSLNLTTCPLGSSSSSSSFHSAVSPDAILMEAEINHNEKSDTMEWQSTVAVDGHSSVHSQSSMYEHDLQMPMQCLTVDLAAGFNASLGSSSEMDVSSELAGAHQISIPHSISRERCIIPSQAQYSQLPTLAEPFEPVLRLSNRSSLLPSPPPSPGSRRRRRSGLRTPRRPNPSKKPEPPWREPFSCQPKNHRHKCEDCDRSFRRPEHLKRHKQVHVPKALAKILLCLLCGREIKDRHDNLTAHLQVTHFKYGKSERGGKNPRVSMKGAVEGDMKSDDLRWDLLRDGNIRFGAADGFYKMMGYSIKETQEMKIKDFIPEWDGPSDTKLKTKDPRWDKLLSGDMTFEQAMETGRWMPESEKEGILGVDMMTSQEMGLQDLDPRWKRLLAGSMTFEESEKLGVTHLNPSAVERQSAQVKSKL